MISRNHRNKHCLYCQSRKHTADGTSKCTPGLLNINDKHLKDTEKYLKTGILKISNKLLKLPRYRIVEHKFYKGR